MWTVTASANVEPNSALDDEAPPDEAPPDETPASPFPLALIASGGGAKGAYMAGQLYYLDLARRLDPQLDARVFTGASAGAINSIVGALAGCRAPQPSPSDNLYWHAWIPTGLNELYRPDDPEPTALLSRHGFDSAIARVERTFNAGLPVGCDVLLGIAITRLTPLKVEVAPGFPPLPRSLETVLLRITGRGLGRPPRVRNHLKRRSSTRQVLLPLDGDDADAFDSIKQLVFASGAFPVGFAPVSVAHCISEPNGGTASECTPARAEHALFVDGGVFANQPLQLAVDAMRSVSRGASGVMLHDVPQEEPWRHARYGYIDPRVSSLPPLPPDDDDDVEGVLDVLQQMLGMAGSARASDLMATFDLHPEVKTRTMLSESVLPPMSDTFSGFIEQEFREFDFYLGMYAAAVSRPRNGAVQSPEDRYATRADWARFRCLDAVVGGHGEASECDGEALTDFRILLQVTLDRMFDHCRTLRGNPLDVRHRQCRDVMQGKPAPRVAGVLELDDTARLRRASETELVHQLRLLGHYQFHFRDLGLRRTDADNAQDALVRLGHRMALSLSRSQPRGGLPLGVATRIGVDSSLGYLPPVHIMHLSVGGGGEIGYSGMIDRPSWRWLRFSLALELDGFGSLLNSSEDYLAIIPKAGLAFEPWGNASVQLRLGARAGYQLSTGDGFGRSGCDYANERAVPCSRLATETYAAVSVLGLLRLHIAGVFLPGLEDGQNNLFAIRPFIGVQLNSPF